MNRIPLRLAMTLAAVAFVCSSHGALSVKQLRCEYLDHPLGIDSRQPRLSWIVDSSERAQRQSAYRILVASSEALLKKEQGDLWDSGKVESSETAQIAYGGRPLQSAQRCFWKVQTWDAKDKMSRWSDTHSWQMGLLNREDWTGRWIGRTTDTNSNPAPMLRRAFDLKEKPVRATAFIAGLGYHEFYINGGKVGDHLLDPGYTRFDRRVLYLTHDVTKTLKRGGNALGVMLGNGWYNVHTKAVWDFHKAPWRSAPKLLLQLRLEYEDGRVENIVSDTSWKASTGPIVFDSIYGGETYDARLEKPGWTAAGFDDSSWPSAIEVEAPKGKLAAQLMPAIQAATAVKPVKITEPKPGVFIVDFGQNLAGYAELSVSGEAGGRVRMRYAERLHKDGTLDNGDIAQHVVRKWPEQQFQTDTYILKGKGRETWHSRFTYHGFQYVEVTGWPGIPKLDSFRARFIHTALPEAGTFECSNSDLNWIQRAALWSYLSNLEGVPTDCPHREKNGWTGDAHIAAQQAMFNFFPPTVYTKWINDLADEQRPTGELPGIVPTSGWGYSWGNGPAWDSAFLLIPYYMYVYYGDARILTNNLDGFRRYVDYLGTKSKDGGIVGIGLNDWAPWKTRTPADITSTGYYLEDAQVTALAAKLAGDKAAAEKYQRLAGDIRAAFQKKFYNRETSTVWSNSQTSLSSALHQGLIADPADRAGVLNSLVAAVDRNNGHIDAGILGTKFILRALLDNGRADVAYRIVSQTNQPGWIWWQRQGATTLWEQWNGTESRNHIMFGDVSAWFYEALAGIRPDPQQPGFKHFRIAPQIVGDLTSASARYDSIRGRIASEWKIAGGELRLKVRVPANTTATVVVPAARVEVVKENGKPAGKQPGIRVAGQDGAAAVFEVASGAYEFTAPR